MLTTAFCCILTEHQSYAILTAFHKHQREFEKTKQIEKNVEAQRNMFPQQKCGPLNCTGRSQLSVTTLPTMNVASSNPLTGHVMSQTLQLGKEPLALHFGTVEAGCFNPHLQEFDVKNLVHTCCNTGVDASEM